jgi:hypothetical protein
VYHIESTRPKGKALTLDSGLRAYPSLPLLRGMHLGWRELYSWFMSGTYISRQNLQWPHDSRILSVLHEITWVDIKIKVLKTVFEGPSVLVKILMMKVYIS